MSSSAITLRSTAQKSLAVLLATTNLYQLLSTKPNTLKKSQWGEFKHHHRKHQKCRSRQQSIEDTDARWLELKTTLLAVIDKTASLKLTNIPRKNNQTPWIDNELFISKWKRFKSHRMTGLRIKTDWKFFKNSLFSSLSNYFLERIPAILKILKFWTFYKNDVKTKSDKSKNPFDSIWFDYELITDVDQLFDTFNLFFRLNHLKLRLIEGRLSSIHLSPLQEHIRQLY